MRDISKLQKGRFDVLIIGGGINGAAIANMAAEAGLRTALIEKNDFASGTSSKSTKLVHGGLRYLENFEFDLVRESLRERFIQLINVPHLVKPLEFIIPVYKTSPRPFWMIKLGVKLYDFLSGKYLIHPHRVLTIQEVVKELPDINQEGLLGGVSYYDAQMDDARLCLENVLSAREKGANVYNYLEVLRVSKVNGKAQGIEVKDKLTNTRFDIKADRIISCVGPWTNQMLKIENPHAMAKIRTTKGVHIVYQGELSSKAMLVQAKKDKRIFFIIPWKGNSLIGTTDTDFSGNPNDVKVEDEDIEYLFKEALRIFPNKDFQRKNIISSFAGLRPLVRKEGSPSKVSRNHVLEESYSGIIYVMGGKYTTYRKIAEDVMVLMGREKNRESSLSYPLVGSGVVTDKPASIAKEYKVDEALVCYLINIYGRCFEDVLKLTKEDESLKDVICSCSPAIKAQIKYAQSVELACKEDDVYWRRLDMGYLPCQSGKCQNLIKEILEVENGV